MCCIFCPLFEDNSEHFWMGQPGVQVRILAGRSTTFGMVMAGKMIWYCASEDAVRTSINNLLSLQFSNAQSRSQQQLQAMMIQDDQEYISPGQVTMLP